MEEAMSNQKLKMRLKKKSPAVVRHTGSNAEREYNPASYEVYINETHVGDLNGYCMGRIQGNPHGHKFVPVTRGVEIEGVGRIGGPRGYYRELLQESAEAVYAYLSDFSRSAGNET